jgi:hypothetical protein
LGTGRRVFVFLESMIGLPLNGKNNTSDPRMLTRS